MPNFLVYTAGFLIVGLVDSIIISKLKQRKMIYIGLFIAAIIINSLYYNDIVDKFTLPVFAMATMGLIFSNRNQNKGEKIWAY